MAKSDPLSAAQRRKIRRISAPNEPSHSEEGGEINDDVAAEQSITVSASPQVPYQVVIATVDVVRTSPDGAELFPNVALGVVR
jgi:hypothetical protein